MTPATIAAGTSWTKHDVHLVMLAGPALAMALAATVADVRARMRNRAACGHRPRRPPLPLVAKLAIAFSLGAASVHAWVCPQHFREAFIYGVFFLVAAAAQLGWVVLVFVKPRRWLIVGALAGNWAVVLLWTYTRLIGDFIGPERGQTEAIGTFDVIATTCEVGVVICTLVWIQQLLRAQRSTDDLLRPRQTTSLAL